MVKIIGNFEVNDWVHWKKMFDQHSNAREAAGIKTKYNFFINSYFFIALNMLSVSSKVIITLVFPSSLTSK